MGKRKILIGQRHGKLLVVAQDLEKSNYNHTSWICECDCGNKKTYYSFDLNPLSKDYKTHCGCENFHPPKDENGEYIKNWKRTRLYRIWDGMMQRCTNPNNPRYKDYGGRGIIVCDKWKIAKLFIKWASQNGYADDLTIERVDVNGNYDPSNCTWIPMNDQYKNKRNTLYVTYNNNKISLLQLLENLNRKNDYKLIITRLENNWTIEEALETPKNLGKSSYKFGEILKNEFENKEVGYEISKKELKEKYNITCELRDFNKSEYVLKIIKYLNLSFERFKIIKTEKNILG